MTFGPVLPQLEPWERRARARCLRLALRLINMPRGNAACAALLDRINFGDPAT